MSFENQPDHNRKHWSEFVYVFHGTSDRLVKKEGHIDTNEAPCLKTPKFITYGHKSLKSKTEEYLIVCIND